VAFMLLHYFCLLEFKFKFEFHCFNLFQTQNQNFLNTYPFPPSSPGLRSPAQQPAAQPAQTSQQPSSPAAGRSLLSRTRDPVHGPPSGPAGPAAPPVCSHRLRAHCR
jgi:hypothetical protein